jgi:NADP-dependent 3-hydroxy acid dehydrogenase YdfG
MIMTRTQTVAISGKHVAVTGAARGIGRAIAQAAAARGATVSIGDLDAGLAAETAAALPQGAAFPLDVCDRASFTRFLDSAEQRFGPIDILVNNAGIMLIGPFIGSDARRWQKMLDVNVGGVITGMQLMLPRMLERREGHVVNMASTAGKIAARGSAVYCGTKSAVIAITESVQAELRGTDVALSMVLPGPVKTELATGIGKAIGVKEIGPEVVAKEVMRAIEHRLPSVYAPRSVGPMLAPMPALPRPIRDRLLWALGAHSALYEFNEGDRAAYDARALQATASAQAPEGAKTGAGSAP